MGGTEWSSDCGKARLILGDCLERLKELPDCSVDSVVTDPPAGIAFMGKDWDKDKGGRDNWIAWMAEIAAECLRVLKPGGHALVWSIPRTSHWTATAWEDAGFQPRDRIAHCFGSGFPKSMDVSKAIDKAAGISGERGPMKRGGERLAKLANGKRDGEGRWGNESGRDPFTYVAATEAARQWQGFGTALKPAIEDWWLLRKPLIGTVAENVLKHGTGAINIDACRVGFQGEADKAAAAAAAQRSCQDQNKNRTAYGQFNNGAASLEPYLNGMDKGRWPANLIHSGEPEVVGLFPQTAKSAETGGIRRTAFGRMNDDAWQPKETVMPGYGDSGSAARFFYVPKASKADRDEGLDLSQAKYVLNEDAPDYVRKQVETLLRQLD